MKVLRPGRQPAEWSREVLCTGKGNGCKGCYALLLVGKDDLFKTSSRVAGVGSTWFITIRCPECGTLTDLGMVHHRTEVPREIQASLMPRLAWEATQRSATTATEATPATLLPPDPDLIAVRRADLAELLTAASTLLYSAEPAFRGDDRKRLSAIITRFDAGEATPKATGQGAAAS